MSWTLTTSGAAIAKAGAGANSSVVLSGALLVKWSDQAEGQVAATSRVDWVNDYADVKTNLKPMLDDITSDLIALRIIAYDMSGYTSRLEAQTMLDLIRDNIMRNLDSLKDEKNREKMK